MWRFFLLANIKSAQKRVQVAERNRKRNVAVKSAIRTALKKVVTQVHDKAATTQVQVALKMVYSLVDRAVLKGILHKNTAARYKAQAAKLANTAA